MSACGWEETFYVVVILEVIFTFIDRVLNRDQGLFSRSLKEKITCLLSSSLNWILALQIVIGKITVEFYK